MHSVRRFENHNIPVANGRFGKSWQPQSIYPHCLHKVRCGRCSKIPQWPDLFCRRDASEQIHIVYFGRNLIEAASRSTCLPQPKLPDKLETCVRR